MKNTPFLGIALCALLGAVSCLSFGCRPGSAGNQSRVPVRAAVAAAAGEETLPRYSAVLQARSEVSLVFRTGGYVASLAERQDAQGRARALEAGDPVRTGQVLASLRQSDYADQLAAARGQEEQAQALFDRARADFKRAQALLQSESLTQSQFDAYRAGFEAASGSLRSARALREQARTALEDSTLRAPFDGTVVSRSVEVGDLVGSSKSAFVVADSRSVKAVFGVSDMAVASLKPGRPLRLGTASLPGSFPARVESVSSAADPRTRLFAVVALVDNAQALLRPGMVATVTLESESGISTAPVVPLSAVVRARSRPDAFAVFVLSGADEEAVARERLVELGAVIGNRIEVRSGLAPGERVVAAGTAGLQDGSAVSVMP